MKRMNTLVALLAILSVLVALPAGAQMRSGRGNGGQSQQMYNPNTVATITGKIVAIDQPTSSRGQSPGVHLQVETTNGPISVHLGPAWYLDRQKMQFKPGDSVEVTGSQVTLAGAPILIASTVRSGDRVLTLRNPTGTPVWSGRGRW